MSDSTIRTLATAVAVAASATFGGGIANAAQIPVPADAVTKQAQAASLMLSMGDLVVVASSPECNRKRK
jgi:hypothetical protein